MLMLKWYLKATALSSINAFTSLMIFYIPFKPVWDLPLLKRQKSLVFGIFCVGFMWVLVILISFQKRADHDIVSASSPLFGSLTFAVLSPLQIQPSPRSRWLAWRWPSST